MPFTATTGRLQITYVNANRLSPTVRHSTERYALDGGRRLGVRQAQHPERVQKAQEGGEDRDQQGDLER